MEARGPSVICGDLNAHHVSWDEYAKGMPRGAELYNWVEENEMAVLNDGKSTRAARFQQGCGLSAPDITIVNSEAADRFSWQPLNELSSDHSPILIKWNQLVKTERAQRGVRPNFQKADWNLFRTRFAEYQPLLEAVTDPATKLKTFVDCVQKAAAIAVPQNVCRKKETPWMNAELKTLIQERNRLRRDIGANRDAWVAKTREVLEKTQEAKRNTWRAHLKEVTRTKDAKKSWAVVKSLNGSARAQDGKTLVYKGREYVSDKAKASAFIQEFATVSGRKSDRSSRRAARQLRSGVRRLLGSPRQELEQAFTPEELATALKTIKAGKAGGPDGVALDLLKHLRLNTQKELMFILNASWTAGWCPQAWRTATIVPFSVIALLLLHPPSGNCLSDSLSITFPGGWRRICSLVRGKPGSASADVPPTNSSDCPSSLAMAFSRQIRNEPSLCSSIILRHTTLSGEPVCSRRCLISESRCVSCSGRRLGLLTALLASNSTG